MVKQQAAMNPALKGVSEHMLDLGLGALRHALRLSLYYDPENPSWPDLSVLHAGHAAEILIKSRIAAEHPLLIFEELPRSKQAAGDILDFQDLFEHGRTLQYQDLPERLWAATGQRLQNPDGYRRFGRIRNAIQHFAPGQEIDPSREALSFIFTVLDPFVHANWGLFAIDFNEECGDHYEHIFESLVKKDIRPLISPQAAKVWNKLGYEPDANAPEGYRRWFKKAMAVASTQDTKSRAGSRRR